MAIMGLKEFRKINTCFRILFERARDWERDRVRTRNKGGASWQKSRTSGFKLAQSYGPGDSPFRFHNAQLRFFVLQKRFRLSWYFLSLSDFFKNASMTDWGCKVVKHSNVPSISATEVRTHGCIRFLNIIYGKYFYFEFLSQHFLLQILLICPNFLWYRAIKNVPAVN